MSERTGDEHTTYLYDSNGNIAGCKITDNSDTTYYYYQFNLMGDVIGIFNEQGIQVATYTYDPWGNVEEIGGSDAAGIGAKNPIRYRGYYYDKETGFYYLKSRYYDPEIGRFLNADGLISTGQDILGFNMFAYCNNNPIMCIDTTGCRCVKEDNRETVGDAKTELDIELAAYVSGQKVNNSSVSVLNAKTKPNMTPRKDKRRGSENSINTEICESIQSNYFS